MHHAQVVERCGDVGVVRAQGLLLEGQGALEDVVGLGVLAPLREQGPLGAQPGRLRARVLGARHRRWSERPDHRGLLEALLPLPHHQEQPRPGVRPELVVPPLGRRDRSVAEQRLGPLVVAGPLPQPAHPELDLGPQRRVRDGRRLPEERLAERQAVLVLSGRVERLQPVDLGLEGGHAGAQGRVLGRAHARGERFGVGAEGDRVKPRGRGHGLVEDLGVGLVGEQAGERLELAAPTLQAAVAQAEALALLRAGVGGLADLGAHRGPAGGVAIEQRSHARHRVLCVGAAGAQEGGAHPALDALVPHAASRYARSTSR